MDRSHEVAVVNTFLQVTGAMGAPQERSQHPSDKKGGKMWEDMGRYGKIVKKCEKSRAFSMITVGL